MHNQKYIKSVLSAFLPYTDMKGKEDAVSRTYQCFVKMSTLSRFAHMRVCFQCMRIFMVQLSFCYLVIKCVNRVKKGPSGMIHL